MRYHHGRLKETLIEAGISILEEEDIRALSLRKVAKRANVSHAAPYRHFDDKIALLAAIAEYGFTRLAENMEQAMNATDEDPWQQMLEIGRCYVEFGIAHPAQLTLMFSDLLKVSAKEALSAAAAYTFTLLTRSVERAQEAKLLQSGDPREIARSVWAMEHGLAMLMKEGFFDCAAEESRTRIIRQSLVHLVSGLGVYTDPAG